MPIVQSPITADGFFGILSFPEAKLTPGNLMQSILKIFLSHPATKGNVAASTQRKALNALVFLYRDVLDQPLDGRIAPGKDGLKLRCMNGEVISSPFLTKG